MTADPKPNGKTAARTLGRGRDRLAALLFVGMALAALPTGFYGGFLPLFLIEAAGVAFALWRIQSGDGASLIWAWRATWPLSLWLCTCLLVALLHLLSGTTNAPLETLRSLHSFAAGLLAIPIAMGALEALRHAVVARSATAVATALLVGSLVAGHLAMLQPSADGNAVVWWPFLYRNHYAAFALLLLPALGWAAVRRSDLRWTAIVGLVAAITGLVSSGSRSGIVALAACVLCFPLLLALRTHARQALATLGAAALLLAGSLALTNWTVLSWRLENAGSPLDGRLEYWRASLTMLAERPLLGWGFGTWPDVYLQFLVRDSGQVANRAHSDWLEYAAEGGVLVLFALTVLFLRSLALALRHPWALGSVALLALAMVDYPLRLPLLLFGFIALVSAAEIAEQRALLALPAVRRFEYPADLLPIEPFPGMRVHPEGRVPERRA